MTTDGPALDMKDKQTWVAAWCGDSSRAHLMFSLLASASYSAQALLSACQSSSRATCAFSNVAILARRVLTRALSYSSLQHDRQYVDSQCGLSLAENPPL
jgi:hypothetical protein